MGITGVELQKHFDFFYSDDVSRLWGRLFSCRYDGDFRLDPDEVESGHLMSLQVQMPQPQCPSTCSFACELCRNALALG